MAERIAVGYGSRIDSQNCRLSSLLESMKLTERDKSILQTLTFKTRLITVEQAATVWWEHASVGPILARRRLKILLDQGLLTMRTLPAYPMLPLSAPVLYWTPGDPDPDADAIAYRLTARWTAEYQPTPVYLASRRTAHLLGSLTRGTIRHPDQITHDLHVSAVYFTFLRNQPDLARRWVGEEEYAPEREHQKLPDAVIKDAQGQVELVVEFGGKYDALRYRAFHRDCKRRALPYQLW